MKLIETMCVLALSAGITVPTLLTFRDAQTQLASQADAVLAYTAEVKRQAPEIVKHLPEQASDLATDKGHAPTLPDRAAEPAVRAYSSRKFP